MPTRRIQVELIGDDRSLSRALGNTGKATSKAEQNFGKLGRVGSSTFDRLRRSVVGAVAAYASFSAAKGAVTATTDLAKSTKALNATLGLSVKTASEFGAQAQIRGVDTRSLSMAFRTLSNQITAARGGSATAEKTFRSLGISMKEVRRSSPEDILFKTSDGLQKLGTGFARAHDLGTLFGRGASALRPLLAGGAEALHKQLDEANQMGASFGGKNLKSIQDLIDEEHRMQLAQLGLQISFTENVEPVLIRVFRLIGDVTNGIRTLSPEIRKLIGIGAGIAGTLLVVGKLAQAWNAVKLAAFGAAAAEEGAGVAGGRWGALGSKAGTIFIEAFAAAALTYELGKTLVNAWNGQMLDQTKSEGFAKALGAQFGDVAKYISIGQKGVTVGTRLGRLIFNPETGRVISASTKRLRQLIGKNMQEVDAAFAGAFGPGGKQNPVVDRYANAMDTLAQLTHSGLGKVLNLTKADLASIRTAVNQGSDWRSVIHGRMNAYIGEIQMAVYKGKISVVKGQREINQILQTEAGILGTGVALTPHAIPKSQRKNAPVSGKGMGKAQGGFLVPGNGAGDTVPLHIGGQLAAFVEPRELVSVNNRASTEELMAHNSLVPRRAGGGVIPSYASAPGGGALGSIAAAADNLMAAAARRILSRSAGTAVGGGNLASVIANANRMNALHRPYLWGGGHGASASRNGPWDCSGAISELLAGSVVPGFTPVVSGGFTSMFAPGAGALSIYANAEHVFASVGGKGFGTSAENPGGGAGWLSYGSRPGFTIRHVPLAGNVGPRAGKKGKGQSLKKGFSAGGVIQGKVSTFGPPMEGAGTTASGVSSSAPGIAIFNRSGLGKMFDVSIGSHHARLRQTDIGPAPWTGRVIDVTGAGARAMGINPSHFPTDSIGRAVLVTASSGKAGSSSTGKATATGKTTKTPTDPFAGIPTKLLKRQSGDLLGTALASTGAAINAGLAAIGLARTTPQAADDIAALQQLQAAQAGQTALSNAQLAYRKAKKGGNKAKIRKTLEALLAAEAGAIPGPADAGEPDTTAQDLIDAMNALTDEIKTQNQIAANEQAVGIAEARRAFADLISGELGGRIVARRFTAGAGSVVAS